MSISSANSKKPSVKCTDSEFYKVNERKVSIYASNYLNSVEQSPLPDVDLKVEATSSIQKTVNEYTKTLCNIFDQPTGNEIRSILEQNVQKTKFSIATSAIGVKAIFAMPVLPAITKDEATGVWKIEDKVIHADRILFDTFTILYGFAKHDIYQQKIFLFKVVMNNIVDSTRLTHGESNILKLRLKYGKDNTDLTLWKKTETEKYDAASDELQHMRNHEEQLAYAHSAFMELPMQEMYPAAIAAIDDVSDSRFFFLSNC